MKYNPMYAQVYERYHEHFTLGTALNISENVENEIEINTFVATVTLPNIKMKKDSAKPYILESK